MQLTIPNALVLIGAVQGFTLCIYLTSKRSVNPTAYYFFLLFLFSLSFFNLIYGLHYMHIRQLLSVPVATFPFPYKYLLGVGFYFYIKNHVIGIRQWPYYKKEFYVFLPAMVYGILRSYWFYLDVSGKNPHIMRAVYDTGFFTINELVYLLFDLLLILASYRFLSAQRSLYPQLPRKLKNVVWLKRLTRFFLGYTSIHLLLILGSVLFGLQDSIVLYYSVLILNSVFIYWIGFVGFTNPNSLLSQFDAGRKERSPGAVVIGEKLRQALLVEELYKKPELKLTDLAVRLGIAPKALSGYINNEYQKNFASYINQLRIEESKALLATGYAKHFTMEALARESGFRSTSSFYDAFKKVTGVRPSDYLEMENRS